MTAEFPQSNSLVSWLSWMETLHPREIELGLERVREVAGRLALEHLPFPVISVAGTNGKGSTVAMLEAILHAAGYRVGAYTSPHLNDYNERVRVSSVAVSDSELCAAFERVEAARGATNLTYFEFGTLAAADLFRRQQIDIAILEIGLGGRLDAVNLWDADVAVISSIGIDHTDWLGPDRESIGREKAGIFRAGRPAICADPQPPDSIAQSAARVGANLLRIGHEFGFERGVADWTWRSSAPRVERVRAALPYPAMRGDYQLCNASGALMALECVAARFPVTQGDVRAGLLAAVLPGRFQTLPGTPVRVLDVAHNAQAAQALAATLKAQRIDGKTVAVAGMLRDKPMTEVLAAVAGVVDVWHLATLATARGASAEQMEDALRAAGVSAPATRHKNPGEAYSAAMAQAQPSDRVVIFGSFYTVGAILRALSIERSARGS